MDSDEARRREEAIAWFAARRAGAMLAEQREAYDVWRADPLNQAALDAVHEKWGELSALKELNKAGSRSLPVRPAAAAIAAVFVASAGLILAWTLMQSGSLLETAVGQQKTQSLQDGSVIALNVVSRASVEIDGSRRLVHLQEGEAAFTVSRDRDRPFSVRVGDYEVRAIGTAFNVRQRDGTIEVSVSNGEVAICSASGSSAGDILAKLQAGQSMSFPAQAGESLEMPAVRRVPLDTIAEWRTRAVSYEDATVGEVVEDFNRYFERKLIVEDPALRDRRVTVRLQVENREQAIRTLAILLDGQVRNRDSDDRLSP